MLWWRRNKERKASLKDAEDQLEDTRVLAERVEREITRPATRLRHENNFAGIVRESIRAGYTPQKGSHR